MRTFETPESLAEDCSTRPARPVERVAQQAEMLVNRLRKNLHRLKGWLQQERIGCYRLYERDIPEIPLIVDWYEGRLYIAEFLRDPGEEFRPRLQALAEAAAQALGVAADQVFLKLRERQRGTRQYERLSREGAWCTVQESGLRFRVNLSDYLDTGLFLDHRLTRQRVRQEADGRQFLNLFAYTGAFTVYAAAGGASSTCSVDLSRTYLDWAQRNLELNCFTGPEHLLLREDVFEFLQDRAGGRRYDLVVLDPPTFSNSKSMSGVLDLQRDHPRLLGQVLEVTRPGGVIYFSTNFRKFRLDEQALAGTRWEEITRQTLPRDFREPATRRCWRIVRGPAASPAGPVAGRRP